MSGVSGLTRMVTWPSRANGRTHHRNAWRCPNSHPPDSRLRLALYSHDTQGLGHIRRNSLVAAALVAARPDTDVLLLTGAPEAAVLPLPPHTDVVTLPTLRKHRDGGYSPRVLSTSLPELIEIREAILEAALCSFAPHLLIADKVPRGVRGELDRPLRRVRSEHGTSAVLGIRDILDAAATTRREWQLSRADEAVAELYDEVWVYGDRRVFDAPAEYRWPYSTTRKSWFTGYLARGRADLFPAPRRADRVQNVSGPYVLGLVGGGQDGSELAHAFATATFPPGHTGVLVTGPYLHRSVLTELDAVARSRGDLRVLAFVPDLLPWVEAASAAVSMGGYNSVCELLAAGCPVLVVPRTVPRVEQRIRARRLASFGLVDVLDGSDLSPARISDWLTAAIERPRPTSASVDLDGLSKVPVLAERMLGATHLAQERAE